MRCPHCGFNSFESAKFCAECGMPFEKKQKDPARYAKERKVVKLPSDASNKPSKPIERPWEVSVPQRDASHGSADASSSTKSDKGPTPRRRTGSPSSSGRIAPIKYPEHESGKIPPEERRSHEGRSERSTQRAASTSRRSDSSKASATLIVDESVADDTKVIKGGAAADPTAPSTATAATAAYTAQSSSRRAERSRRSAQRESYSSQDGSDNKTKPILITIAILIIICLIALGIFMVNTGSNERTVSFDTDGGTVIGNQYVIDDGKLDRPANPTRPGYVFDGWYLDSNLSEKAEFPLDVTQDMTLYAKWKKESDTTGVPSTITTPEDSTDGSTDAAANNNAGSSIASGNNSGNSASSGSSAGGSKPNASSKPSTGGSGGSSAGSGGSSSGGSSSTPSNLNGPGVTNGKVNIRLIDRNGVALTGTVTLHDGYVIPDSSKKAYTIAELKALNLNDAELCIARNEIYAREGYSFLNSGLQSYFNARGWYKNKGWRGQLPEGSAAYITAHNLLALAKQNASSAKWTNLRHS